MDNVNVFRTGMNMSISRIHVWLCNMYICCLDAPIHSLGTAQ